MGPSKSNFCQKTGKFERGARDCYLCWKGIFPSDGQLFQDGKSKPGHTHCYEENTKPEGYLQRENTNSGNPERDQDVLKNPLGKYRTYPFIDYVIKRNFARELENVEGVREIVIFFREGLFPIPGKRRLSL